MDPTNKIIVRLSPDTVLLLQALVNKGHFNSLSECIAEAISQMIEANLTSEESEKALKGHVKEQPLKMESLLTDNNPESMDEAVRKAVRGYVKSRMDPEE
ncbi:hypothetical protein Mpt1_c11950 [Candidatus Methanoplasma termitum]|uniref:Uncharacterized protein n=1 Tax=Candidatus Methanoplasma termitum TaxID=1577791 RepID=A0A0A7LFL5_9ARCH|nr:hypothetical protein [Candidatus Methanoplasma termitum]AIZ57057.1 hypothetical protein Mpt1_c11950 [Candidatus Methanoplasma termitum]MCL2334015.1 hypothetical protein [Candidatus Methanoplasma sp.]